MAGKYVVAALLGLALTVSCSDIIYDDKMAVPVELFPLEYISNSGHPTEEQLNQQQKQAEEEIAPLSCYDCTSYMSSCKREVRDMAGQIVSRTGCKTKCFLRVGEEQSGALYRGCMDDFLSATALNQDYVGCQVQEWNSKKSLWCLCGNDLCNGQSLKALFYYGFGSPNKVQYLPDGKAYLVESVDERFNDMTRKVHNYNSQYEEEPLPAEPIREADPLPSGGASRDVAQAGYTIERRPLEDTEQPEEFLEQLPYPNERPRYEGTPEVDSQEPESYGLSHPRAYEEYPYGLAAYPISRPEQLPLEEQFLGHAPNSAELLSGGAVPPYYQYPQYPGLGSQLKHPAEEQLSPGTTGGEAQGEQLSAPEGKSAVLPAPQLAAAAGVGDRAGRVGPVAPAFPAAGYYNYPSSYGYPYHYGGEMEPLNYVPGDERLREEQKQVVAEEPLEDQEAVPLLEESLKTSPDVKELDSELYCPAAGIFTYEEDCSKFVMCLIDHIHGKPRMYVMKCPADLVFDSIANTCMQPEMSDGCKRLPPPEPEVPSADKGGDSRVNQVFDYGY